MNEWIPITEKLPKSGDKVLVYLGKTYFGGNPIIEVASVIQNELWVHGSNMIYLDNPDNFCGFSHWMKLPEPPK